MVIGENMAFKIVNKQESNKNKKIKEHEACEILYENPQHVKIFNVGKIMPSQRKAGQFYCYVDYELEDGRTFGISYSFNRNGRGYFCGVSSKLYNLLSGFLDLNPLSATGLFFEDGDIEEALLNKEFIPSIKFANIGGNVYPFIISDGVIV